AIADTITATAETRELIPSLALALDQSVITVPRLIPSSFAISLSVRPSLARSTSWVSREVRCLNPSKFVRRLESMDPNLAFARRVLRAATDDLLTQLKDSEGMIADEAVIQIADLRLILPKNLDLLSQGFITMIHSSFQFLFCYGNVSLECILAASEACPPSQLCATRAALASCTP